MNVYKKANQITVQYKNVRLILEQHYIPSLALSTPLPPARTAYLTTDHAPTRFDPHLHKGSKLHFFHLAEL